MWDSFKHEILNTAQESIRVPLRLRQNYISLEATDACHMTHLNGNWDMHRSLVHKIRPLLRRDKNHFIRNLTEEDEGCFLVNDRPAYQVLRN